MARVVVLGGGFGGAAAALEARRLLPAEHSVVLIDRSAVAHLCGANPLVVVGAKPIQGVSRSLDRVAARGVEIIEAEVLSIEPAERRIVTSQGVQNFDHLVLALGTSYDWDAVPGSSEAFTFYDFAGARDLHGRVLDFKGGRVLIAVARPPYKCPPAPLETAMLFDWYFRRKGVREAVDLRISIPEPAPLAVIGPEASSRVRQAFDDREIGLATEKKLTAVENGGRRAIFSDGEEAEVDLLVVVPVHRVPQVVADSGLTADKPWVPVDPATLQTSFDNIWAVGDVTGIPTGPDRMVPKAGVFASGEARTAAQVITSRLLDVEPPPPYDGIGHCFFSFSGEETAAVGGHFLAPGGPQVSLGDPSTSGRDDKLRWEEDWRAFRL